MAIGRQRCLGAVPINFTLVGAYAGGWNCNVGCCIYKRRVFGINKYAIFFGSLSYFAIDSLQGLGYSKAALRGRSRVL
jgi:hypothetical protein